MLLGTPIVLWNAPASPASASASPSWNAALDVCPHRLAALSSGRLEDGILTCRYHGWAFSGDGGCVANPQAADAKAEATVCSSARARLQTLPCKVEQGLIWVWPTPGRGAASTAAATPLPLYPETSGEDSAAFPGSAGEWGFQVAPVDWTLMTENSLDPSHAPFLHEKVMGPNTRAGAAPCVMKLESPGLTSEGFTISHGGYTKKQIAEGMVSTRGSEGRGVCVCVAAGGRGGWTVGEEENRKESWHTGTYFFSPSTLRLLTLSPFLSASPFHSQVGIREFKAPGRLRAEVRQGGEGSGGGSLSLSL